MGPNENLNNSILETKSGYKIPKRKGGQPRAPLSTREAKGLIGAPTVPETSSETEGASSPVANQRGPRSTHEAD